MCKSIFTTCLTLAEGSDLEIGLSDPSAGVVRVFCTSCGFLKKVDSVNVTLLLILLYVDFLAFSPVRG